MSNPRLIDRANHLLTKKTIALAAIVPLAAVTMPVSGGIFTSPVTPFVGYVSGLDDTSYGTTMTTFSPDGKQATVVGGVDPQDGTNWDYEGGNDGAEFGFFIAGAVAGTFNKGDLLTLNYDVNVHITAGTATLGIEGALGLGNSDYYNFVNLPFSSDEHFQGTIQATPLTQNLVSKQFDGWQIFITLGNWSGYQPTDQIYFTTAGSTLSIISAPEPFSASLLMLASTLFLLRRPKRRDG